ncbi:MAG: TetR family transcriptional regulator [Actinobacteria bacterium]|nr:TetR family transcriptional regulator [Actinomycetota bacterium]
MPAGTRLEEVPGAQLSPRARRVAKTRRAIIDAARALIDEQGYDHTTIDQIADRADIAPRTFFRYFSSKEALVFAEFDELRTGLWTMLDARPAKEPPLRSLVTVMADYADQVEANRERLAWGFRIAEEHPSLTYEVSALKADTIERITAFLASRLAVDPENDPRPHGWAVATMGLFSAAMSTIFRPGASDSRSARKTFLALVGETGAALKTALPR